MQKQSQTQQMNLHINIQIELSIGYSSSYSIARRFYFVCLQFKTDFRHGGIGGQDFAWF